ncbi:MAG: DNA polymerase III subunit alpha, partial [Firmicutes bacterium]|nr:DNA polymerase III subunit alpha [Bacillota bacterium]
IEELGLLKMDFLGLRNLTVIRDALELIKKNHGVKIDFSKMGYDDPKVYEMISAGNTGGVFQLESGGMTQFMKNLKPTCFEDIVAGISLYRPGPMDSIPKYIENKKNPENIKYVDQALAPILDVTYGCLVYQEQVMQIVRDLGGYSYGRSDLVRRAMSKKKMDVMLEEKKYFIHGKDDENGNVEITGCLRNGISEEAAEVIFEDMISFAQYAFNKSHAAAYAVVAYETGWLKAHYPVEFMAALMTSVMGDSKQIARYIRNCADMGITVLPPCVAASHKKFSVEKGKIRFGMLGIKNVGEGAIEAIIAARKEKGVPKDIFSFISNVDISQVNKKAVESLIKAGACDCLSDNRAAMLSVYEGLVESAQNTSKKNIEGQMSLFQMASETMNTESMGGKLPDVAPFAKDIQLAMEKEMLGVYLTDHPLNDYVERMKRVSSITCDDIHRAEEDPENADIRDGMSCVISGMISGKKTLITKSNKMMAFLDLEDLYGIAEVVVFPNVYERCAGATDADKVVAIRGTINFKEDEAPKILADEILDIDEAVNQGFTDRQSFRRGRDDVRGTYVGSSDKGVNASYAVPKAAESPVSKNVEISPSTQGCEEPAGMVKLRIEPGMNEEMTLQLLKTNLARHRGNYQVLIYLPSGKMLKTDRELWVQPSEPLSNIMIGILGKDNVKM